jgi:acyl-CoA synthetase (NDP forming)
MTRIPVFGEGFPPESIGIVGVSRKEETRAPGYSGLKLFRSLRTSGYTGRLYPINPKTPEIDGAKTYPDVMSVPESLDLVVIAVPAAVVPKVLEDCITARARNIQICTSGFGENGTEEGKLLDDALKEIIQRGNLRVLGPNCMGFHIPSAKIRMFEELELAPGPVAFITQSGGHARAFLLHGPDVGIGFSKVFSYGNALTMDAVDFLDYLADDPETGIICMYLEGIKDGKRLVDLVTRVNPVKPVIVWKAGLTEPGARASASHTGSLKGDEQVWNAFYKQTGAVRVDTLDEMLDATMSFISLQPIARARAAVLGIGGGATVANGDTCGREGIETPPLSEATKRGMSEYVILVNQGMANPMDIPAAVADPNALSRTLELVTADPETDLAIVCVAAEFLAGAWGNPMPAFMNALKDFIQGHPGGKPIVVAIEDEGYLCDAEQSARKLREAGITVFPSLARACRALRRFAGYHDFKTRRGLPAN